MHDSFVRLLAVMPKLHVWDGVPQQGGFNRRHLEVLHGHAVALKRETGSLVAVETGAGLSTLAMLAAGPDALVSICSDPDLYGRIEAAAREYGLDLQSLRYHTDRSELVLPRLALDQGVRADLCVIDGGHGYPTTFVDFCYMNVMLRRGGLMLVDDLSLLPPRELFFLLKAQPGWTMVAFMGKMALFRKDLDAPFMPDFGGQIHVRGQSVAP